MNRYTQTLTALAITLVPFANPQQVLGGCHGGGSGGSSSCAYAQQQPSYNPTASYGYASESQYAPQYTPQYTPQYAPQYAPQTTLHQQAPASVVPAPVLQSPVAAQSPEILALLEVSRQQSTAIDGLTRVLQQGAVQTPSIVSPAIVPAAQPALSATQFDPQLVQILLEVIKQYESRSATR